VHRPALTLAASCLLVVAACSDDDASTSAATASAAPASTAVATSRAPDTTAAASSTPPTTATTADTEANAPLYTDPPARPTTTASATTTPAPSAAVCDPATAASCLLPWPNNAFTEPDEGTSTGLRLAIPTEFTPRNAQGVPIDVTDQNRADGFSPGSAIIIDAPGVDLERSGLAPSTDIGSSLDAGAPIVITDMSTGEPWPYWGELDAQAAEDADRLLILHPAISLAEGHSYRVDVSGLVTADGAPIELDVSSWTFTIASAESLSGRMLHIRNEAYNALGDAAPTFTVTISTDSGALRTVEGTIDVPLYLSGAGEPGSTFVLDEDGLPTHNAESVTFPAPFRCVLPVAPAAPVPTIVYGHGLLGNRNEVDALSFAAEIGVAAACATDWIGMSSEDIDNVAANLGDLSNFNTQADRMQQGLLDFQWLGRALNDERSFASDAAFQTPAGTPIIAAGETQFVGNSQGGILGGAASAISTEWERAVLGVPGINYSLLLHRSSDWPQFQAVFDAAYTTAADRLMALQLIQLLWDRGENNGYAQHVTGDPYPGIEEKDVLLIEAFGDHQVANVSTEVLARTMDVPVYEPSLAAGRSADVDAQWGLDPLQDTTGSALYVWDFGTPAPPTVNLPPTDPEHGEDPHGAGSREQRVLTLAIGYLLSGELADVCGGEACVSDVLTGS
jgi:hypothetical protein